MASEARGSSDGGLLLVLSNFGMTLLARPPRPPLLASISLPSSLPLSFSPPALSSPHIPSLQCALFFSSSSFQKHTSSSKAQSNPLTLKIRLGLGKASPRTKTDPEKIMSGELQTDTLKAEGAKHESRVLLFPPAPPPPPRPPA